MRLNRSVSLIIFLCITQLGCRHQPVVDIHFAVITNNKNAQKMATKKQLKKEVELLNRYFVTASGKAIVTFRYKSATLYQALKNSECQLVRLGDSAETVSSSRWAKSFNSCNSRKVRDPQAINFYVYDSYSAKRQFADKTSQGKRNSNQPYILMDWERLNHTMQSPEEHEMGHALGLSHVCVPGAKANTSTNIMASSGCGKGSGGLRNIGFNSEQVAIILSYVAKIQKKQKSD